MVVVARADTMLAAELGQTGQYRCKSAGGMTRQALLLSVFAPQTRVMSDNKTDQPSDDPEVLNDPDGTPKENPSG